MNQEDSYLKGIKDLIVVELSNIDKLKEELIPYAANSEAGRIKGSILHDFYNICERIFKLRALKKSLFVTLNSFQGLSVY